MLPSLSSSNFKCSRGKRPNCIVVSQPGDCAKRLALETGEDFLTLPQADDEVEGSSVVEEESFSNSASGFEVYTTNYNREGQSVITQDQPGDFSAAKGAGGNTVSSTSPLVRRRIVLKALQISRARRLAKMEGSKPSQRTPEEVELALEVLNDELAGASPLDRPSLELATQALTDRLIELRKQQRGSRNPPEPTDVSRQSTHEYSSSLQAVIVGDGRQKYTLIKIPKQDDMHGDIYLVRGDPKAEYHYQTAIDTLNALQSRNILSDVTGGGRMDVLRAEKKVEIYGYSYQYGAADHSITAKMVKEYLGDEFIVSFGNYGY